MNIGSILVKKIDEWLNELYTKMYSYHTEVYDDVIEVHVQETVNPLTKTLVLRVLISKDHKQVHIPNIFIPIKYHRQGLGFGLVKQIFIVTEDFGYELFIVDMTPSFYDRLLSRNALQAGYDAVKIIPSTRL